MGAPIVQRFLGRVAKSAAESDDDGPDGMGGVIHFVVVRDLKRGDEFCDSSGRSWIRPREATNFGHRT